MEERTLLERITVDPQLCGGRPMIQGKSILVEDVLSTLVAGAALEEVCIVYPEICRDDVLACLEYARQLVMLMQLRGTDLGPKGRREA